MQHVKYTKNRTTSSSPTPNTRFYGTDHSFTNANPHLFQDNSFEKHKYLLSKDSRRLNTIEKEFSKAKSNVEKLRSQIHYSYITKKQLLTVFKRKKQKFEIIIRAVVKIQKAVRGFLTRKKLANELVGLQQRIVKIRLMGLDRNNKHYLFFLGKAPGKAAVIIQRSVRRFLFRLKILKYLRYYERLLQDRAEKIFSVIRKHLKVYSSKTKIEIMKFNVFKAKRLEEIKRKLAISKIAKIYRKNKWSFKVIKHRLNKYKRKIRNSTFNELPNNFPPSATISNHPSIGKISVNDEEPAQDVQNSPGIQAEISSSSSENERFLKELQLKNAIKLRKYRIKFGKISHSIGPKPESPNILPLLYEKDLIEGVSVLSNYGTITRATASRISESRPKRSSPIFFKSKTPVPHVKFVSKRQDVKPIPLHKKETVSFKMSKWDSEEQEEQQSKTVIRPRFNSTVLRFTFSQMQKRRLKPIKPLEPDLRPKTTLRPIREYAKKQIEPRPYSMTSKEIVFNKSSQKT